MISIQARLKSGWLPNLQTRSIDRCHQCRWREKSKQLVVYSVGLKYRYIKGGMPPKRIVSPDLIISHDERLFVPKI